MTFPEQTGDSVCFSVLVIPAVCSELSAGGIYVTALAPANGNRWRRREELADEPVDRFIVRPLQAATFPLVERDNIYLERPARGHRS